jgi:hypothetical protein
MARQKFRKVSVSAISRKNALILQLKQNLCIDLMLIISIYPLLDWYRLILYATAQNKMPGKSGHLVSCK